MSKIAILAIKWGFDRNLLGIFTLFLFLFQSCVPYKFPTESICIVDCPDPAVVENQIQASHHWLYKVIPRHRCQIEWYDLGHWCTWALFGNDDDGIFGEGPSAHYQISEPITGHKALRWGLRNPLHNFSFYVIGTAYMTNSQFTLLKMTPSEFEAFRYYPEAKTTFPSQESCFYLALHGWKPFLSLRLAYPNGKRTDAYLGWRCRGNFGLKFHPLK